MQDGINDWQFALIQTLLTSSTYDHDKRQIIESMLHSFDVMEADTVIQDLYRNQLDPITHGTGYGMKDIIRHLNKLHE